MIAQPSYSKINLACGSTFVTGDGWINLDYTPSGRAIRRADLLGCLPLQDGCAELVYSSHFVEHIPYSLVPRFFSECRRILAPGGLLRLVLPDLENICRTYLECRQRGEHEKADFVVLELLDQCVRSTPGGQLLEKYQTLKCAPYEHSELIDFVRERTGGDLLLVNEVHNSNSSSQRFSGLCNKIKSRIERTWVEAVLNLLPSTFRIQNTSVACVGERHHWIWDYEQLYIALEQAGFESISRCDASVSRYEGFPFEPLDLNSNGQPRKGAESMYIEAINPAEL